MLNKLLQDEPYNTWLFCWSGLFEGVDWAWEQFACPKRAEQSRVEGVVLVANSVRLGPVQFKSLGLTIHGLAQRQTLNFSFAAMRRPLYAKKPSTGWPKWVTRNKRSVMVPPPIVYFTLQRLSLVLTFYLENLYSFQPSNVYFNHWFSASIVFLDNKDWPEFVKLIWLPCYLFGLVSLWRCTLVLGAKVYWLGIAKYHFNTNTLQ